LSQHIGDLENLPAYDFFRVTVDHLKRILEVEPEIIAFDMHPDYLSSQYAAEQQDVEKIKVQHHHAHIVSCMAEHQLGGQVIGLPFDGTGFGPDHTIWGGEVLISECKDFERAAHLACVPMPGGSAAIKQPWRMAVSYLYDAYRENIWELKLPAIEAIKTHQVKMLIEMMAKQINSPMTSSLGRLFDGVAAIVGLRSIVNFEGQAAMELEMAAADEADPDGYPFAWTREHVCQILPAPIIRGVVADLQRKVPLAEISAKFHRTLIRLFTELCVDIRKARGLNRVVLSGGCFQNTLLLNGLSAALQSRNFEVYSHTAVPSNDGGISLGQAVAAAAIATQ
jgi:hydrogenase maturation protein HypF